MVGDGNVRVHCGWLKAPFSIRLNSVLFLLPRSGKQIIIVTDGSAYNSWGMRRSNACSAGKSIYPTSSLSSSSPSSSSTAKRTWKTVHTVFSVFSIDLKCRVCRCKTGNRILSESHEKCINCTSNSVENGLRFRKHAYIFPSIESKLEMTFERLNDIEIAMGWNSTLILYTINRVHELFSYLFFLFRKYRGKSQTFETFQKYPDVSMTL